MKRTLLILVLFIFFTQYLSAQQKPQYTQYIFNYLLINPAVTGIENYTDAKAGYRSQWTGLNGAPVTSYLTVDFPLGDKFIQGDATSFPAEGGVDPSSRQYTQEYMASEPHHGLGFSIVSDVAGPINTTNIDVNYAYHIGLTDKMNLSLCGGAGAQPYS